MNDIRTALDSLHDRLHETVKRADALQARADADWGKMASVNNAWSQKDERLAKDMAAQEWSEAQVRAFCEKNEWGADRTRKMIDAFKKADAAFGRSDAFPPGYKDETYKGYKIIIGAGDTYAAFKNGVAIKTKFASVDKAKEWIDKQ